MQVIKSVTQSEVWEDWRRGEPDRWFSRGDILNALPQDLHWQLCEVESLDVDRLFIISSDDWSDISGGTFRFGELVRRMDLPTTNAETIGIRDGIRRKIDLIDSGIRFSSRLIAITESPLMAGSFTVLEGNHRTAALLRSNALAGAEMFVGYSAAVTSCVWARHTYEK